MVVFAFLPNIGWPELICILVVGLVGVAVPVTLVAFLVLLNGRVTRLEDEVRRLAGRDRPPPTRPPARDHGPPPPDDRREPPTARRADPDDPPPRGG